MIDIDHIKLSLNKSSFQLDYSPIIILFFQVESLTPQVINAGRIRMVYPENKAAADHFENLRSQFAEGVQRVRGKISFVPLSEKSEKLN